MTCIELSAMFHSQIDNARLSMHAAAILVRAATGSPPTLRRRSYGYSINVTRCVYQCVKHERQQLSGVV